MSELTPADVISAWDRNLLSRAEARSLLNLQEAPVFLSNSDKHILRSALRAVGLFFPKLYESDVLRGLIERLS